jgi:hypothetical protein
MRRARSSIVDSKEHDISERNEAIRRLRFTTVTQANVNRHFHEAIGLYGPRFRTCSLSYHRAPCYEPVGKQSLSSLIHSSICWTRCAGTMVCDWYWTLLPNRWLQKNTAGGFHGRDRLNEVASERIHDDDMLLFAIFAVVSRMKGPDSAHSDGVVRYCTVFHCRQDVKTWKAMPSIYILIS